MPYPPRSRELVSPPVPPLEDPEKIAATFAELRRRLDQSTQRPTVEALRRIVDDVRACVPLADTAAALDREPLDVLDVAAKLGIWISHVHGGAKVRTVTASSQKKERARSPRSRVPQTVVIPLGYQSGAGHQREVGKALAALVVFNPDDEELSRFIARQYRPASTAVEFSMISTLWYAATQGRLSDTVDVNTASPRFLRSALSAYEILRFALDRLGEALVTLRTADLSDLDALASACQKAHWVAEREIAKLQSVVDAVRESPAAWRILERELQFFRRRLEADPTAYGPRSIAELTKAQVRRIAEDAGVTIETSTDFHKAAVRTRLREMGLGADVDVLIHRAAAADRAGILDEFWDAMASRVAGDPDWDVDLAAALSAASSPAAVTSATP